MKVNDGISRRDFLKLCIAAGITFLGSWYFSGVPLLKSSKKKFTPGLNFQAYWPSYTFYFKGQNTNVQVWDNDVAPNPKDIYNWVNNANAKALSIVPYYGELFNRIGGSVSAGDIFINSLAKMFDESDDKKLILRINTANLEAYTLFGLPPDDPILRVAEHLATLSKNHKNWVIDFDEPNWYWIDHRYIVDFYEKYSEYLQDPQKYNEAPQEVKEKIVSEMKNVFKSKVDTDVFESWVKAVKRINSDVKIATSIERDNYLLYDTTNLIQRVVQKTRLPESSVSYWKNVDIIILVEYFSDTATLKRDLKNFKAAAGPSKEVWGWVGNGDYRLVGDALDYVNSSNKHEFTGDAKDLERLLRATYEEGDGSLIFDPAGAWLWNGKNNPFDKGEQLETVKRLYKEFA